MENLTEVSTEESWTVPVTELNLAQMDKMVAEYRELRVSYETAKAESNEKYHLLSKAEAQIRESLVQAGKSKYFVDGLGTVSLVNKSSFTTPKTIEDKLALFAYIRETHGEDALIGFLGIHSGTLNSFANKELETDPTLSIPGLQTPTVTTELRFRKD